MRQLRIAALALVVAACSDSGTGPRLDAGALIVDATVAPDAPHGFDAGLDAGGLVDAGHDAAALGSDAGHATDAASRDAGPTDAGCTSTICCSIVPQTGCPEGEACRYQYSDGMRTGVQCEPAGGDRESWPCERYDGGGDSCMPGLFCSGTCFRSCRTDADCRSGQYCDPGGLAGDYCSPPM